MCHKYTAYCTWYTCSVSIFTGVINEKLTCPLGTTYGVHVRRRRFTKSPIAVTVRESRVMVMISLIFMSPFGVKSEAVCMYVCE